VGGGGYKLNAPSLNDKVLGCLLASALGNVMGSPVENQTYENIEKNFGRITSIIDPGRLEIEDDNRIGLLLCQAYLEKGGPVTPEDLAKIWLREVEPTQFFWCIRNTYLLRKSGVSPRLTGIHNIVTGSAIMAMAPVGLFNAGHPDRAFVEALQLGYMVQPRLDTECAAVIAGCVAEAMKKDATCDSIVETGIRLASDEMIQTFDDRNLTIKESLIKAMEVAEKHDDVFEARADIYENLLQWHAIDPMEVLTLTLCIFKVSGGDVRSSIIGGVNIGRDSDTIGNLNGALSGTLHGAGAIPGEWIEQVGDESVAKFRKIASDMTQLIIKEARDSRTQAEGILKMAGSL